MKICHVSRLGAGLSIVPPAAYAPYGGVVACETLLLPDGERPLQALFRYLERVARSREFTYLPPLFGPGEGLPMAGMYVELAVSHSRAAPMPRAEKWLCNHDFYPQTASSPTGC